MVNYYKNNTQFVQPFTLYQADGETPYNLTQATVTWYFKDTSGTVTSITGSVTNAALGQCSFTVTSNFFSTVMSYTSQIIIIIGTARVSTDPPFTVQVLQGSDS